MTGPTTVAMFEALGATTNDDEPDPAVHTWHWDQVADNPINNPSDDGTYTVSGDEITFVYAAFRATSSRFEQDEDGNLTFGTDRRRRSDHNYRTTAPNHRRRLGRGRSEFSCGCDCLVLLVHPVPGEAWPDGACSISLIDRHRFGWVERPWRW
jgi:hypothetical protein